MNLISLGHQPPEGIGSHFPRVSCRMPLRKCVEIIIQRKIKIFSISEYTNVFHLYYFVGQIDTYMDIGTQILTFDPLMSIYQITSMSVVINYIIKYGP